MADPRMFIPARWINTGFGRRYYTEGWQDALAGKEHRYLDVQAQLDSISRKGQAALTAYEDGYKAGAAARHGNAI
jgi:hypothetical protein